MSLPSVLQYAHVLLAGALSPGDVAIDATVGNGHDTVFLADCVGEDGRVFGFDVQQEALETTAQRLSDDRLDPSVTLLHDGHEQLAERVPQNLHGQVSAVVFNLGYLPGSDHAVTTEPATTLRALDAACTLLRDGGVITAVLYSGHDGGRAEMEAVHEWADTLSADTFLATVYRPVNRTDPPQLLAVERRTGGG
jgi:predicted O-methyltransferase YrrM